MNAACDLMSDLTEAQRTAVQHVDGPLLVLAGPGSGKTTVVTRRIAYLVDQGIPAWQILALTFTNKAAAEMRRRVEMLLPEDLPGRRGLTVATFHSFCVRLLRRYADIAGLPPRFSVYDSADQRDAVKQALGRADLSSSNWTPAAVASAISSAKNKLLDAEAYAGSARDFFERSIARAYREYERILKANQALDFDDLLMNTARMLREVGPVCRELQSRYQYLLIDEYQDTNHAQFVIAQTLASAHGNICVVGDPDQSIYGWRGADIGNILEFEAQWPSAAVVPLGQNFRSTDHIVQAAAGLIAHNRRRKAKVLSTELGVGAKPTVIAARDEHHEARIIVNEMKRRHGDDELPWKSMAVLYRINALSRVLEEAFRDAQVPYVIARGTAFYARKEVKDALAYLRLIVNHEDEVALRRIVNDPPRGIGQTTWQRLETFATGQQLSLLAAMRRATEAPGVSARAATAVGRFTAMIDAWDRASSTVAGEGALTGLVEQVVRESGLETHYRKSGTEEDQQRLANLGEPVSAAAEFLPPPPEAPGDDTAPALGVDVLAAYLESVALVSDSDSVDPENGAVTLMTLHTAKGLEFDVVAIAGLEHGLLPHGRAMGSDAEMEEERRLCFVGITRAARHLLLTRAAIRTQRGMRQRTIDSPFLDELPPEHVTVSDQVGDPLDWDSGDSGSGDRDDFARPARSAGGFEVGCLVHHRTFGLGRIDSLMPRPVGSAARIVFESVGAKTLILEHAKLTRVD